MGFFKRMIARVAGRIDFSSPGSDLLYVVFDRLKAKSSASLRQPDPSMVSIRDDIAASELMPVAVAIIALKKASVSASYLRESEFEELCERAADNMASFHAAASALLTKMLPQLPGLSVTAGHNKDEASEFAGEKVSFALSAICVDRTLLPVEAALFNLCNLIGEKLKINRFQAKDFYEGL
jgi:hypothetical protein